jgi:hypothetical protein
MLPRLPLPGFKKPKLKAPKLPPKVKAKMEQGVGKLRRFALTTVQEEYVEDMRRRRLGECLRCGLCCRLVFECPFLQNLDRKSTRLNSSHNPASRMPSSA